MGAIRFTNLTGAVEIGANCYLLELGGKRILLDAGSHPKKSGRDAAPRFDLIADDSVDAIVMSHAHQDHIGSLPIAMRRHPRAPILLTEPTLRIGQVMLHNSVNVMMSEKNASKSEEPVLFTHREVDSGEKRWLARPLHQRFDVAGERAGRMASDVTIEFYDAGHIIGSVGTLIRSEGRTVFYAGDVQFEDQTISRAAAFPDFAEEPCDVMIMESTRGDRETPAGFTREGEQERLIAAIQAVFARGGCVMIPLFALGKTQELLAMLHEFRLRGQLKRDCPIYIGGLGTKLTDIYDKLAKRTPRHHPNLDLLNTVSPFTVGGQNVEEIRLRPGRIFALSSGMMTEKTLSNVIARQFLSRPENAILFVGYADPDSPAGRLRDIAPGAEISLAPDHRAEPVICPVEAFNFSAHASRESIRAYVNRAKPKKLVLVHGDPNAIGWMTKTLQADLPQMEIVVATPGVALEL